ncbi:Hypothetical protein DEACI_3265 [Acididesulfobacillus acetoxydans]|uniref:Uncharacterized protein n=1 Tax=Acididesulfobacillus acetoxydans TaxID=1561005 RepID=A0A8S0XCL0_9FIRM|nr:Hypothetical protein DEACI_3265 [Acididesulfobacillus acetoxydans]CEJ07268.1 Hypothetical protein DEACI_1729 [Acididesulfobacillus acetoxydans]
MKIVAVADIHSKDKYSEIGCRVGGPPADYREKTDT